MRQDMRFLSRAWVDQNNYHRDDMLQLWQDMSQLATGFTVNPDREVFLRALRATLIDPEDAEQVVWCEDCEGPEDDSYTHYAEQKTVCASCIETYCFCYHCEEYINEDYVSSIGDNRVCDNCIDRRYTYCDNCERYINDDWGDHDDDCGDSEGDGCCESAELQFAIRNDGDPELANDVRVKISLPAGTIDDEGMSAIRRLLRRDNMYDAADLLDEVGPLWQTRQGNFTKRLSRTVYNKFKQSIAPEILSEIGTVARDHSNAVDFWVETTRDLNQPASYFHHEDSCWWQSYYKGRCMLKTNGGFAMRSFNTDTDYSDYPAGRAFIFPLKLNEDGGLTPTYETLNPDAYIVFNGYGNLGGYHATRILAHMVGGTYRKVTFYCSPMYINSSAGYLVGPEGILTGYTDGEVSLNLDQHADLHQTESRENTYAAA